MKNSKFTESQIVAILKLQDAGMSVSEICRQQGVSFP
jgi:putative transposase